MNNLTQTTEDGLFLSDQKAMDNTDNAGISDLPDEKDEISFADLGLNETVLA